MKGFGKEGMETAYWSFFHDIFLLCTHLLLSDTTCFCCALGVEIFVVTR